MTINPLTNASTDYYQSLTTKSGTSSQNSNSFDPSSLMMPQDSTPTVSPAAQMLNQLQKLQQQNPAQFQQLTAKIAANLQKAAADAQASGNTTQATQLTQLATQFQNAPQTGQIPSAQDMQKAGLAGHHGHHHHSAADQTAQNQTDPLAAYQPQVSSSTAADPLASLLSV